jgi:hypothetical protein
MSKKNESGPKKPVTLIQPAGDIVPLGQVPRMRNPPPPPPKKEK